MSTAAVAQFKCEACGRAFAWKQELAGKRVKCKCGAVIAVPTAVTSAGVTAAESRVTAAVKNLGPVAEPPDANTSDASGIPIAMAGDPPETPVRSKPVSRASTPAPAKPETPPAKSSEEPDPDDMYDLAPSDEPAKPKKRPPVAATGSPTGGAAAAVARGPQVLGYKQRTTAVEQSKDRFRTENLVDMTRDVYAPIVLLVLGQLLYVGYYAFHYHLGASGIAFTSLGLGILTVVKAVLLIGFAFVVAGPLGVSFGGIWTAVLKLAAIAVFSDGVTTWVDAGLRAGGAGGLSTIISFPVSLGVYWALLIYLFSMDSGDSWTVVIILTVFDNIVRWLLLMILLNSVLSFGGVAGALPVGGGGSSGGASSWKADFKDQEDAGTMVEAKKWVTDGHSGTLTTEIDAWYAAGSPKVWYDLSSRDINGRQTLMGLIVELPDDKDKRAACYKILNDFEAKRHPDLKSNPIGDDGEPYFTVTFGFQR